MKIVLEMKDLKDLLKDKFDIEKIFIAGDDLIIHGKPKEQKQKTGVDFTRPFAVEPGQFDYQPPVYNPPPQSIPQTPAPGTGGGFFITSNISSPDILSDCFGKVD